MFTLVKFSCGCIGTKPVDGSSTVISSCDNDGEGPEVTFYTSDRINGKTYLPLNEGETAPYRAKIEKLIYDGYRMKSLKRILDIE